MVFVSALDAATICGGADGSPGEKPRFWVWDLTDAGDGRPARLLLLRELCDAYFAEQRIDCLFYDKPLPIAVASRIGSDEETQAFLRGSIGVIESCAAFAGIPVIHGVDIKAAREHLIGQRTFPKETIVTRSGKTITRSTAKRATIERCRLLGWNVTTDDEADAVAIWSYGCGRSSPRHALSVTPLFAGR